MVAKPVTCQSMRPLLVMPSLTNAHSIRKARCSENLGSRPPKLPCWRSYSPKLEFVRVKSVAEGVRLRLRSLAFNPLRDKSGMESLRGGCISSTPVSKERCPKSGQSSPPQTSSIGIVQAAVVVTFMVCRANDSRLVIDRFKRGRVTINKPAIRRDPQLHKTLLTQG